MTKADWLAVAEVVDALRIVPRLLLAATFALTAGYVVWVTDWFMRQPEHSTAAAAVLGITVPAVTGIGGWVCKVYIQSGRRWGRHDSDAD